MFIYTRDKIIYILYLLIVHVITYYWGYFERGIF